MSRLQLRREGCESTPLGPCFRKQAAAAAHRAHFRTPPLGPEAPAALLFSGGGAPATVRPLAAVWRWRFLLTLETLAVLELVGAAPVSARPSHSSAVTALRSEEASEREGVW